MIKRKKDNKLTYLGLFLIIISFGFFSFKILMDNKINKEENKQINIYVKETSLNKTDTEKVEEHDKKSNYIAVLEIPDINLKRGLLSYNSKYNNVNYNIQIIEQSNMLDILNGNLILASHSGTSNVSFFRNLDKLNENSLINIYYNGYKYIYKFSNSYDVDKDGVVEIKRDKNKNTITLITCKKNSENKQVVNIGYLIDKIEY